MKRASILVLFGLLTFAVMPAFAQSFNLIAPNSTRLVRAVPADLPSFTWQPVATATDYDLTVFKVSTNPRDTALGTVFTANVAAGSCAASCSYVPNGGQYALFDRGEYAWTVVADLPSSDIEAANGPLFFSVEPNALAFIANGAFETGTLSPWKAKGLAGDKVKAGIGTGGSWGFIFKGSPTENAKLTQKAALAFYGIDNSDTLTFRADYRATSASVQGQFVLKLVYTVASGLPKDKVTLTAVQNGSFVTTSTNVVPDGPLEKIKVQVVHKGTSGKFFVDNVQVILAGQP